jgi:hypothetical protein
VPFADAVVTLDSLRRAVPLTGVQVYVRSVLPGDTSKHRPKPARDVVLAARSWWPLLLALVAALVLLALLGWWWWRRRRAAVAVALDPLALAEREFARIDALGLLEAGERGRFVALNLEVMRDYLAERFHDAPRSLTSTELLAAMLEQPTVPIGRLAPLLAEADLVKFAARLVTSERARQLATETRAVVREIDRSLAATASEAKAA